MTIKECLVEPMMPLIYLILYRKHGFQILQSSLMAVYCFDYFFLISFSGLSLQVGSYHWVFCLLRTFFAALVYFLNFYASGSRFWFAAVIYWNRNCRGLK